MRRLPQADDVRFILETIDMDDVKRIAKANGWDGSEPETAFDYSEPQDAARHRVFDTLDKAAAAGRTFLATGNAAYGCVTIDRQVYELDKYTERMEWERHEKFEIAMDGEMIKVES